MNIKVILLDFTILNIYNGFMFLKSKLFKLLGRLELEIKGV